MEHPIKEPKSMDELTELRIRKIKNATPEQLEHCYSAMFGEDELDEIIYRAAQKVRFNFTNNGDFYEDLERMLRDDVVMAEAHDMMREVLLEFVV